MKDFKYLSIEDLQYQSFEISNKLRAKLEDLSTQIEDSKTELRRTTMSSGGQAMRRLCPIVMSIQNLVGQLEAIEQAIEKARKS